MTEQGLANDIAAVRAILERIERATGAPAHYPSDDAIARSVRCEMAHLQLTAGDLAPWIHKTVTTASYRVKGTYRFKREELPQVAAFLGLTLAQLLELAALHDRAAAIRAGSSFQPVAEPDPWILPGRRPKRI